MFYPCQIPHIYRDHHRPHDNGHGFSRPTQSPGPGHWPNPRNNRGSCSLNFGCGREPATCIIRIAIPSPRMPRGNSGIEVPGNFLWAAFWARVLFTTPPGITGQARPVR